MLGVAIILGFLSVAALLFEFGDPVGDNLRERGISDTNRVSSYLLTIRSILDIPLLGYGYGTFADVFPMYRDRSISVYGTWEQAHDTYLEIFQGLGLVFGSMLCDERLSASIALHQECDNGASRECDRPTRGCGSRSSGRGPCARGLQPADPGGCADVRCDARRGRSPGGELGRSALHD